LTTQSPSDVDRSILKRLLTRFLHSIEVDQLDSLRGVFSDASEELVTQLPKMPVGTCVLTGAAETIKHATMINVRSRETTHGGKTPEIWSEYEKAGWKGKKSLPYIRNKE
jgi:DNA helicase HerA-like ATPase